MAALLFFVTCATSRHTGAHADLYLCQMMAFVLIVWPLKYPLFGQLPEESLNGLRCLRWGGRYCRHLALTWLLALLSFPQLHNWVQRQRKLLRKCGRTGFDKQRLAKLDGIGFNWDPLATSALMDKKRAATLPKKRVR